MHTTKRMDRLDLARRGERRARWYYRLRGFRIVEIPIVFVDRTEGQSKMSKAIVREAIWMVWRLRWLGLTKRA